ncbi:helix-turn-helix domain-containing protein [Actinomadura sp.]|jgi:excisionase family DNA binding protein|uniref:helix-turn-helix domain-containing protein n=2 Tax=Actinomadura sp. TaxID=1989 RepID=UPI0033546A7E
MAFVVLSYSLTAKRGVTLRGGRSPQQRDARPNVRLYTPGEAAAMLQVRESWLRKKASARAIPCTFIGKHLRFSDQDIAAIIAAGAKQPVVRQRRDGF